jgi:predicted dehydrogenase
MAVYDDIQALEKIRVYDTGIETESFPSSFGEFLYSYRYGDIHSPRINEVEPLRAEVRAFVDAIVSGIAPKTDGWNGLRVVETIEAADTSLRNGGGHVPLRHASPAMSTDSSLSEVSAVAPLASVLSD